MKKHALTLIELLVVIVVIGILIAILIPVLGRARESARRIMCANNLRQWGIVFHLYLDEHNNMSPGSSGSWFDNLKPYIDDENIWNCPDKQDSVPFTSAYSYGVNRAWIGSPSYASFRNSQIITLMDTRTYSGLLPEVVRSSGASSFCVGDRHSGGANVLFLDGRVGWYLRNDILSKLDWGGG